MSLAFRAADYCFEDSNLLLTAYCLLLYSLSLNYRHLLHVKWPEEKLTKWKAVIIPA